MAEEIDVGIWTGARSTEQFANNFLRTLANEQSGNLITSPLSAQMVLAMAAYGASGTTAMQMRSALFIPSDDELGQSGYQSLIKTLNTSKGVELRLANKIYISTQAAVKPAYKILTAEKFLSSSQKVDFQDAEGAARVINAWCEKQTNKRIKDLISPENLRLDAKLVLVNAVYFKGQWEKTFRPDLTGDRPFHVNEATVTDLPTMFIETSLRFGRLTELSARFIEIPYQGGEISMIIILPNEINGLRKVQDNLHKVDLSQSLHQSSRDEVQLFLPKFKIESTLDLNTVLQNLGMTDMFGDNADFSCITDTPLKVSKVIQKAFIEVNEEGSEAAAATGKEFTMLCISHNEVFDVNRPFYYQIRSKSQNVPLFVGLYTGQQ